MVAVVCEPMPQSTAHSPNGIQSSTLCKWTSQSGELTAKEDITIEGLVDGKVDLDHNVLTIGQNGTLKAQALAKTVVVMGKVLGNITATENISIRETAAVEGDAVVAPSDRDRGRSYVRDSVMPSDRRHALLQVCTVPQVHGRRSRKNGRSQETSAPSQQAVADRSWLFDQQESWKPLSGSPSPFS